GAFLWGLRRGPPSLGPGPCPLVWHCPLCPRRLRSRQPGHRNSIRAARHVVQAEVVASGYRVGVARVLAADADFEVWPSCSTLLDRNIHQAAYPGPVDRLERVDFEDSLVDVADYELSLSVVTREAESGLGQVVGAEGEELGVYGDLAGDQRSPRHLDHRPELVLDTDGFFALDTLGHRFEPALARLQLRQHAHQRDHDLGAGVDAFPLQVARRFHDRPHLHPGDLRIEDREAHAAQPEHGVGFAELLHPGLDLFELSQPARVTAPDS